MHQPKSYLKKAVGCCYILKEGRLKERHIELGQILCGDGLLLVSKQFYISLVKYHNI